jgi:hypothetical protein
MTGAIYARLIDSGRDKPNAKEKKKNAKARLDRGPGLFSCAGRSSIFSLPVHVFLPRLPLKAGYVF